MRPIIIGTGFLGRAIVDRLKRAKLAQIHTFHSHKHFEESIRFDLHSQNLSDVVSLLEVDTVILTSKIEDSPDTWAVMEALRCLLEVCREKRVVYVSTDAVFDGKRGMYLEGDVPNAIVGYGKHKMMCEDLVRALVPDCCIVRTSYIYGYSIGVLDERLSEARALVRTGEKVPKFTDMFKSPTEVNQLADIIIKASQSQFKGVLHVCGLRLSIYDFFRQALGTMGEKLEYLIPDKIPDLPQSGFLVDTSLDSTLLKNTFGFEPVPFGVALDRMNEISTQDNHNQLQSSGRST
jgi:dTDP-4-dehydrorhamnose reductase